MGLKTDYINFKVWLQTSFQTQPWDFQLLHLHSSKLNNNGFGLLLVQLFVKL